MSSGVGCCSNNGVLVPPATGSGFFVPSTCFVWFQKRRRGEGEVCVSFESQGKVSWRPRVFSTLGKKGRGPSQAWFDVPLGWAAGSWRLVFGSIFHIVFFVVAGWPARQQWTHNVVAHHMSARTGYSSVGRASDCRFCRHQMVPGSIPGGRIFRRRLSYPFCVPLTSASIGTRLASIIKRTGFLTSQN